MYQLRVVGLGLIGYAYITIILTALLAVLFLLGALAIHHGIWAIAKLFVAVLVLVGVVLRAFWVKFEPPAGRALTQKEVPRLFELTNQVIASTGAPRLAAVLLTGDLNAGIQQRPRFGPVFGYRNYLVVGLPLLEALSLEEFRAVLAHECGHLSGAHGKAASWVYRLRTTWANLAGHLEASSHWGRRLFVPFFHWYAPRFVAYSFVMAREQEYAADKVAARATNAEIIAAALVRVDFMAHWLAERFWPTILKSARLSSAPNATPFAAIRSHLTQGFAAADRKRWLAVALARHTDAADTHPSLRDRLDALGVADPRLPAFSVSAAEALLGPRRAMLAAELDLLWQRNVAEWWQGAHASHAESRARRARLERKSASQSLSSDEQLELAALHQASDDPDRAKPLLEAVLTVKPDNAVAHARLGALLAHRHDPAAIRHLELAIRYDRDWMKAAGEILFAQLMHFGRTDAAEALLERMLRGGRQA
jgi:Zn-dependent protease with chaperone function